MVLADGPCGMTKLKDWLLRWWIEFQIGPDKRPTVIQFNIRELDAIGPGEALHVCRKGGSDLVILNADDFDHVAALAGLKAKEVA